LTQAERTTANGKNAAAESLYRQIIDEAPDAEEGWLGLASVSGDPDQQRAAYERVLAIAPGHPAALDGLDRLDGKSAAAMPTAVAEPAGAPQAPIPPAAVAPVLPPLPPKPAAATLAAGTAAATVHSVTSAETYPLVCYRHADRETALRCYSCSQPICSDCARKTPVGYICPDCQRQAEDAFFNNKPTDYLVAALVSLPISLLAGFLMVNFFNGGFLFFLIIFFVSGAVGTFIARVTKRAIGNRRGRYLPALVVAMMVLGVLIPALPILLAVLSGNVGALTALIGPGIYLFVASSAAYWQMR
jgi:hypothetical protein